MCRRWHLASLSFFFPAVFFFEVTFWIFFFFTLFDSPQATSTSTEQYGRSQDEKARSNQQANAAVWTRGSESESDTTDTWIGPAVPLPKMFYDVLVRARVVLHGCGAALGVVRGLCNGDASAGWMLMSCVCCAVLHCAQHHAPCGALSEREAQA